MNKEKKVVVVLGMHRSGTSAITRGLQVVGVNLGNKLIPPIEGQNDKGFWEDLDIHLLNDEMLKVLDSDWHFLTPIQPKDVEILIQNGYLIRAIETLKNKMVSSQIFGFKDPRIAKLLPFWKTVFFECRLSVSYVIAIRNPLSVSDSLTKRNEFDAERNYLLWLGHILSSLNGTSDENRVLIDYDCLIQSPETELVKLAKAFQLTIDKLELESFKTEFLDEQLRHTVYHVNDLLDNEAVPPLVMKIYSKLFSIAKSTQRHIEGKAFKHEIIQWNSEFSHMRTALVLADKLTREAGKLTRKIDSLNQKEQMLLTQLKEKEQQVQDRDSRIANIETQLAEIYASRSWRMTAPIRAVIAKLRLLTKKEDSAIDQPRPNKS
jgi:hypothetical protein